MRCIVQKVSQSNVVVEGQLINEIQQGYMILVGFTQSDTPEIIQKMVDKIIKLRIFEDMEGKMNRSIVDVQGEVLAISQFTLYANAKKGNRPDFLQSAPFNQAQQLYQTFLSVMNEKIQTKGGVFGGDMKVSLTNDGPVTIVLDSIDLFGE